jgi:uncharacterized membrane protein
MSDKPVFLYAAVYSNQVDAKVDLDVISELHKAGVIGTYDAALVTREEDGKVKVHKHEKPTQHGAWTGVAVGAVLGILFPPSIVGSALLGGVTGGLIGHFWRGMSRKDVKELGELLDEGQAAVIVVGHNRLEEALDKAMTKAVKRYSKEMEIEAEAIEKACEEAEAEAAKA